MGQRNNLYIIWNRGGIMANTFELIASSTVGSGGASSIDFTSIASTWTDLCLKVSARGDTSAQYIDIKGAFNSDTTNANYNWRALYSIDGTSAATSSTNANYIGQINAATSTSNTFSNGELYIPNYTVSQYKSYSYDFSAENNATASANILTAGLWSNTAAITSISISCRVGNFVQYSTAYLYGVKNA